MGLWLESKSGHRYRKDPTTRCTQRLVGSYRLRAPESKQVSHSTRMGPHSCAPRCIGATAGRIPRTSLRVERHPGARGRESIQTLGDDLPYHQKDFYRSWGCVYFRLSSDLYPSANEEGINRVGYHECQGARVRVKKDYLGVQRQEIQLCVR